MLMIVIPGCRHLSGRAPGADPAPTGQISQTESKGSQSRGRQKSQLFAADLLITRKVLAGRCLRRVWIGRFPSQREVLHTLRAQGYSSRPYPYTTSETPDEVARRQLSDYPDLVCDQFWTPCTNLPVISVKEHLSESRSA